MLAGLALKWRWRERRRAAGLSTDRPNMVLGSNVQVVWEKFCRYWDVEARYVPITRDRYTITPETTLPFVDENTIGVVAILGTTYTGEYEPIKEIADALDRTQRGERLERADARGRRQRRLRRPVPAARPRVGLPAADGSSRSTSRATSTGSPTPASAGSSGATRPTCPRTWSST